MAGMKRLEAISNASSHSWGLEDRALTAYAFSFVWGGGVDILVTKSIAIRPAQLDFVLTRFGSGFTNGNQNQSTFRYQGDVVFRF